MTKVLVTGADGQLGQSLLSLTPDVPLELMGSTRADCDISDARSMLRALDRTNPKIVINTAAYTAVDQAEAEPDICTAINATGPGILASACAERGIKLIHISTDYVFDGRKDGPYVETDAPNPQSVYGRTKLAGEQAIAAALPAHVIVRTAWVHSPYGANFVKTMLRLAKTRDTLGVVDDQIGCPTYAPDLARALLVIAEKMSRAPAPAPADTAALRNGANAPPGPWGVFHAAHGGATSWCGFAQRIFAQAKAANLPYATATAIPTADYPTPAQRPANSQLSTAKLHDVFGFEFPSWETGADQCVQALADLQTD